MSDIVDKFDQTREILTEKLTIHRSYQAVFSTPEADKVLRHIMRSAFVITPTFVRGDPEQTLMNEGSRRLALSILRMARTNHREQIRLIEQELNNTQA